MTVVEFSNEFDVLYNNIMSNKAPGLSNYEKSLLLTEAQEMFVKDIYNGKYLKYFESSEDASRYISNLVKQVELTTTSSGDKIDEKSVFYEMPEDLWFITYEFITLEDSENPCLNNKRLLVKPITQDTYFSISKNPFRRANSYWALRLTIDNKSEIISDYNIKSYTVRYISKPSPIILENLSIYNTSIDNKTDITECKLHPSCHRIILELAVNLAKKLWDAEQ